MLTLIYHILIYFNFITNMKQVNTGRYIHYNIMYSNKKDTIKLIKKII